MNRIIFTFLSIISLLLSGCFKEETPVLAKDRGNAVSGTMELGPDYSSQIYFSLNTKKDIKTLGKFDWDIGLSGNSTHPFICLNTSKSMYAYRTDKTSMLEIKDTIGRLGLRLNDYPCGSSDSLALSGILYDNLVYIVDPGYDASFQKEDYILLKASIQNNAYLIEYAHIDGTGYQSKIIPFDENYNLSFYHFKTGNTLQEPKTSEWDILMTQYQHVYYNPFQTYSVVGCLINQSIISACEYKGAKSFEYIKAMDTLNCVFSNRRNIIGFGWKYFDLNNNQYIINPKKTYFIRRHTGMIYKLHFTDFYNNSGVKGTAAFEFQEI